LSSIRDAETAVVRHYCESLYLAIHLPPGGHRIVDLGSGAGFPGFPIAVARPECSVVLVESHQRKAAFLKEAARGCLTCACSRGAAKPSTGASTT
jgi:16S rRNA (guanine527-N7)-methyltransferase